MKVTAFVSSSSHNGNTARSVKRLLEGAASEGAEMRIHYLNDYIIKPCVGCRVCETTHVCIQKEDDVPLLHQAIREADAYVLGTPTYYGDITGQFKQFVDRCYPFIDIHKDPATKVMTFGSIIPVRKPGILVALSGSHGPEVLSSHRKVAYHCLNDINGYLWREVYLPFTSWNRPEDMEQWQELFDAGSALARHLLSGGREDLARTAQLKREATGEV